MKCGHTKEQDEQAFMHIKCLSCAWDEAVQYSLIRVFILREKKKGNEFIAISDLMEHLLPEKQNPPAV